MSTTLDGWSDKPGPLPHRLVPVEPYRDGLLPTALRGYVRDVADRMQAPAEMVAAPLVVAAGSLIGRSCAIRPKERDDWCERANLWGMLVGSPSVMKSPTMRQGMRPLQRIAALENEKYEQAIREHGVELAILKAKREALLKSKKPVDALKDEVAKLQEAIDALQPKWQRYITQDPTVEKLGELLRANPRGLLVLRDEIAGLIQQFEKPERASDRAFYLEGWSGQGEHVCDRIMRGTVIVRAVCLSVFGTTQPSRIERLLVKRAKDGDEDDGLIQRFSVTVWPDVPRGWKDVDRFPDSDARKAANAVFERLARLAPERAGAEVDDEDEGEPPSFGLDRGALGLFREWRTDLETRLRSSDLDPWPTYVSHLTKYRKMVPSMALIFHLVDIATGVAPPGSVSLSAMQRAAGWAAFLEPHAQRLYGVELDPGRAASRHLERQILAGQITDGMRVRELKRAQWSGLTNPDHVDAGLAVLEAAHWLHVEDVGTPGRPRKVVRLHPVLVAAATDDEDDDQGEPGVAA